jgi:hydrogenase maturation protease
MNQALVDRIANAVLYEGYILYPYRPSVKNRQRWTFGGLYPQAYSEAQEGTDAWTMQTQCLVKGGRGTVLDIKVRFLHLVDRTVGEIAPALAEWPQTGEPAYRPVEVLRVGRRLLHTWQEAVEREIDLGNLGLTDLAARPRQEEFAFAARRDLEPVRGAAGEVVGVLVRRQQALAGAVVASAEPVEDGLFRLTVQVRNLTPLEEAQRTSRDGALLRAMVSTHTILGVREGEFVSLTDPPERWREAAAGCSNLGTWPVLVGEEGQKDTLLSAPIILSDYPQIAPESPGDLFDGTEIDEILTLRILTLTDAEKEEMAAVDERARALLERTEALAREQLLGLHGTVRRLHPLSGEGR